MKFKGTNLSKRTIALLAAALVLLGSGGTMGTRAVLNIVSPDYDATIQLDEISVQLTEKAPGKSTATVIDDKGKLFADLEKAEPGMPYTYEVGVKNNGGAPEYVRVIVRKYWTKDGKDTNLSPALIELNVDKDVWLEKKVSDETYVYYLKNQLSNVSDNTATLFNSFRISDTITSEKTIKHNGTVISEADISSITSGTITYEYKYNGYKFTVEAEAQSIQTHNAADAIRSVWGVNATVSGNTITAVN